RDRHGGRALRIDAHWQRAYAAHREPTLEGRRHGAAGHLDGVDLLIQLAILAHHEHAAKHVAVAAEVLGRGMHRDIGAQLERTLKYRRAPGIVDRADGA